MSQLPCFLLFFVNLIIFSFAKNILPDPKNDDLDQESETSDFNLLNSDGYTHLEKLWVLDINDEVLDNLTLRSPTSEEVIEFNLFSKPLIEKYKSLNLTKVKNNTTLNVNETSEGKPITKKDILNYLNKFALFSKPEPEAHLSDFYEEDEPSITINFKGQYTAMIVKTGTNEWQYFYSAAPFPAWFYGEHDISQDMIPVPENLKEHFYSALYCLLQKAINYLV